MKFLIQPSSSLLLSLLFSASFFLSSCKTSTEEVNIYTHRHYEADLQIYDHFTEETGIKVNVVSASADELIQKLELEGSSSPADILITVDAGRLERAKNKGLLQPVSSVVLENNVPDALRDKDKMWFGLTKRARIFAYSLDRIDPAQLSSYEDLADEKWRGKLLTRSSENIYNQSLLASLIHHLGEEETKRWAENTLGNMARPPKGNDRDQVVAVAAGEGDIAIVNTYYIGLMIQDQNEEMRKAVDKVGLFFPNQSDRGTHINISGGGVTRYAPNKANAITLLEFLSEPYAQSHLANSNFEYPVNKEVEPSPLLKSWGSFKEDTLHLSVLGENNQKAVMIFDQVKWK